MITDFSGFQSLSEFFIFLFVTLKHDNGACHWPVPHMWHLDVHIHIYCTVHNLGLIRCEGNIDLSQGFDEFRHLMLAQVVENVLRTG